MPTHIPDDERRAADPSTEPEVLEYLAKAFPDPQPIVTINPAIPAVLCERTPQTGVNDLPNVPSTFSTGATDASDTNRPRTVETACLPMISTADYSSVSMYSMIPVETVPQTMTLGALLATPATAPTPGITAPSMSDTAPAISVAPALSFDRPAPRSGSCAGLMTVLVVTLIFAVAAAGVFGGMLLANYGRQSDTTSALVAAAAPSLSVDIAAEQVAPPIAGSVLPSGLAPSMSTTTCSYQYVDTPSKNISCILSNEGVSCSILERNYASSGIQDCPDREFSIMALAGRTKVCCGEEYLGQPGNTFHTLEYGETTTSPDYACTSQSKGMTCWNTITG